MNQNISDGDHRIVEEMIRWMYPCYPTKKPRVNERHQEVFDVSPPLNSKKGEDTNCKFEDQDHSSKTSQTAFIPGV